MVGFDGKLLGLCHYNFSSFILTLPRKRGIPYLIEREQIAFIILLAVFRRHLIV